MDKLSTINELGFRKIGSWRILDERLSFDFLEGKDKTEFLYAFVCGNEVLYVGKSTQTVYRRMMAYKNPGSTQRTNVRNNANLIELLSSGSHVDIYVLEEDDELAYRGYKVNLAAGLEDAIISKLKPEWNQL